MQKETGRRLDEANDETRSLTVNSETVNTLVQPKRDGFLENRIPHFLLLPVKIGLFLQEEVEVVL